MTLKNYERSEEELTSRFKIDISNLTNLTRALESLKNLYFNGLLLTKSMLFELKKYRRVIFHDARE